MTLSSIPRRARKHNAQILNALTWRYRDLSPKQRALIILLRRHAEAAPDAPLAHGVIIRALWGADAGDECRRNLTVLAHHTNRRLSEVGLSERLIAVYGEGYVYCGGEAP